MKEDLETRERTDGLRVSDLLDLPEPFSGLLNWMIRQGQVTLAEVSAYLQQDEKQAGELLAGLVEKGYARELDIRGQPQYRVRLAPRRGQALPEHLRQALGEKAEREGEDQR